MAKYKEHQERKMKVLDDAADFTKETYRLLKNEKIFPKSSRWLGVYELANLVSDFHTNIFKANEIVVSNRTEAEIRRTCQNVARADIIVMEEKITVMAEIFEMDRSRLDRWLACSGALKGKISAWMRSDDARYSQIQ